MPGVTFQEPTDLLGEGDSLHLARAGRRPQRKAGQGTRGLLRRRRQAEGRRVAPEAPVPRLSPGAQQQGGSAGRVLRKRRAQRAAARGPWAQVHARACALTGVARKVKGVALYAPHQRIT